MPESKSGALPLGDIPMPVRRLVDTPGIIAWMFRFCNPFFRFFREFSGQKFRLSSRPVIANQSADWCVMTPGRGRFPPIMGHSKTDSDYGSFRGAAHAGVGIPRLNGSPFYIRKSTSFSAGAFCVGITYLPGKLPCKYCRRG